MAKIKISEDIEYSDISKEDFKEFIDVLEEKDAGEYAEEGADGFADLYNYWEGAGNTRFQIKLRTNKAMLEDKKNADKK